MTLIVAALSKYAICVSTDTQLTFATDGKPAGEAVKSNYIYCKNGKFLAAYTGNDVYLEDGVHVSDWITNLLSSSDIRDVDIAEINTRIVNGLNEKYYYRRVAEPLVIVVVGWLFTGNQAKSVMFRITNCEAENSQPKAASKQFELFESEIKRDVVVRGSVKIGVNHQFDSKVKYIKKLLKSVTPANFRDAIGERLYELNAIAHNHPDWGKYIGEKTMLSIIYKRGDGVDYWRYPNGQKDYLLPNFNNGVIAVKGLQVHNDPFEGGTITLDIKK